MQTVFVICCFAMTFYIGWMAFAWLMGVLHHREEQINSIPRKIAIFICAKDEEKVIGNLLDSLHQQDYPKDGYKIFVVAHNCTDQTAAVVREKGDEAIICDIPGTKATALNYGLDYVNKRFEDMYPYFAVFDADALVSPNFLKEINKGLCDDVDVISGYYGSKNLSDNLVSNLSGILYHGLMNLTCLSHHQAGLPVNIYGSGYVMKMEYKDEISELSTLVQDFELSIRLVMKKCKMIMAPKAMFYAEMPVDLKEALKQRRRWAYGDKQCWFIYRKDLLKKLPSLGINGFKALMDLLMVPTSWLTFLSLIVSIILYEKMAVQIIALAGIIFYLFFFLVSASALKKQQIDLRKHLVGCLLEPFWVLLTPLMTIDVLFIKEMSWQRTKRNSYITIEEVNK